MKKVILRTAMCIGLICFIISSIQAQTEKTGIGVLPFTYTVGAATEQDAIAISDAVTDGFVRTKRFNIVYRSKVDKIFAGLDLQKSDEYVDEAIVEEGKSLGAEYLIAGNVSSAMPEAIEMTDATTGVVSIAGYKAKLAINVRVIEVSTGKIITSENFEPKGGSTLEAMAGIAPSKPEAAVAKAIKDIEPMIDEFVSRNFPVTFFVVEIIETKDGGAAKILISGGTGFGLKKGDKLKIVELIELEVDGNKLTRKKVIGEIKVTEVEDENFSQCQVTSGGIEIKNKFEAKARLRVMTLSDK
jgi:TolB-like protein